MANLPAWIVAALSALAGVAAAWGALRHEVRSLRRDVDELRAAERRRIERLEAEAPQRQLTEGEPP